MNKLWTSLGLTVLLMLKKLLIIFSGLPNSDVQREASAYQSPDPLANSAPISLCRRLDGFPDQILPRILAAQSSSQHRPLLSVQSKWCIEFKCLKSDLESKFLPIELKRNIDLKTNQVKYAGHKLCLYRWAAKMLFAGFHRNSPKSSHKCSYVRG